MGIVMNLFTLFGLVGVVSIITRSYIMQPIREKAPGRKLRYMLNCPQCSGFWVGLFYGVYDVFYTRFYADVLSTILIVLLWGGLVSLASSVVIPLMDYVSFAKTDLVNKIANSGSGGDDDDE